MAQRTTLRLFTLTMILFIWTSSTWASTPQATLDADELVFDEARGVAEAEGNASLKYQGVRIYADNLELDTNSNKVRASSSASKGVTILSGGKVLKGSYAEYDLKKREGSLRDTVGSLPLEKKGQFVHLRGDRVEVATVEDAIRKGWISSKRNKTLDSGETVGRWVGISVTTCPRAHPHYRLKAKRLTLIPGENIVVKSPQVYIGDSLLFTYPFNYKVNLKGDTGQKSHFMPLLGYDSDKGAGLGLSGPFYWENGYATLSVIGWTSEGLEWSGRVDQDITPWLKVYGETAWEYESSTDEKTYRPKWGLEARSNGWLFASRWSQREALKEKKSAGNTYKTTLWRMPEIEVASPWYAISSGVPREYFRIKTTWGKYEETGKNLPEMQRYGWTGEFYSKADLGVGRWEPFGRFSYTDYYYDNSSDDRQKITNATLGVSYRNSSGFEAGTAYVRRWVNGRSGFIDGKDNDHDDSDSWDDYDDEELIYQRFGFNLSKSFRIALTGAYDLDQSMMDEMDYELQYSNACCYKWVFTYRDDMAGGDDWAKLSFQLTAFPDRAVRFGEDELDDPFKEPEKLPRSN